MRLFKVLSVACACMAVFLRTFPIQAEYTDSAGTMDGFQLAQTVFSRSGAVLNEIKIETWGQISNGLLSCQQLEEKYKAVARGLDLAELKPAVQAGESGFAGISGLAAAENETRQLSLYAVPSQGEPGAGKSFLALLYTGSDTLRARQVYSETARILQEIKFGNPLGVTFVGQIRRTADQYQRQALAHLLASGVYGRFVEGVLQDDFASLTYYAPAGCDYLVAGGSRINLQIAFRTGGIDGHDYLYVGTPLIYQDY